MRIDFHVHSKYSHDGFTEPETIIKTCKKKNLGIAITDHDNCQGWQEMKTLGKKFDVPVVLGQEIKCKHKGKKVGELMGLFLNEPIKSKEYKQVIDEIKAQGAMVCAPHPFDFLRKDFKFLDEEKKNIDAVEVFNSRCYFDRFNDKALKFALENNMVRVAGSDAHCPWEIGMAFVEIETDSLDEFRKKLEKREGFVQGRRSPYSVHIWSWLAKIKVKSYV
jgi:predicted metal-dependent phosphoesterase TrpH